MTAIAQTGTESTPAVPLAIILEGVSETWGMNVLQILGRPASAKVELEGLGTIEAPAIFLSQSQARHLATQIIELLGPESRGPFQLLIGSVAG